MHYAIHLSDTFFVLGDKERVTEHGYEPAILYVEGEIVVRSIFNICVKKEQILKVPKDKVVIKKEMEEAERDLEYAKRAFNEEDDKRAIREGYYAIMHALRAALMKQGYRAKDTKCQKQAIDTLFVKKGKLDPSILIDFEFAVEIHDGVEIGYLYNREDSRELITITERILDAAKLVI